MRTLTREEAAERARLLEVASYDVALDLRPAAAGTSFLSTTTVRFTCRVDGASSFLELDGELLEGTLDGRPMHQEGSRIPLTGLGGVHEAVVRARCSTSRSGEGLHRFVDPADGETYLWAQSFLDDAQRMFACFDQPDLKATFSVSVVVPPAWTVVLNGRADRAGDTWSATVPRIPPYLFHVSAGPWHGVRRWHGGIETGLFCRASLAPHLDADADELFTVTARCLDHQQRLFGRPYPFGDSYDQLFVPEFNHGAMENPGAVTFTEDLVFRSRTTQGARRRRAMVVAHEMAHMWFGDLVTMRWYDDLWLNESFAELLGFLTVDEATDFPSAWLDFAATRKAWGYRADAAPTSHPVSGEVADNRSALLNFDGISYAKGASVLRQLSVALGPDTFFAGVRDYLDTHAWGSTGLVDLLAALQRASGRDLTGWAQEWLRTSGTSLLRTVVEDGEVLVVQEGDVLRAHRLAVGRYARQDGSLVLQERRELDVAGARTRTGLAPADLVLVNDGDLTFARTRFDPRSLATVVDGLDALEDPLARVLCCASLWDALRDGDLPAATYLRAVAGALRVETDPSLLEALAGQAQRAAAAYTPPADAPAALAALADVLAALPAPPGSDRQLVALRAWAGVTEDAPALREVLAGGRPGLQVDDELRWHLLHRLAALGAVTRDELEAARAADDTAAGHRAAAAALAARPDAEGKAAAWEAVTADASLSNHEAQALATGFWQRGQQELLAPYVARYTSGIEAVWADRSPELAQAAARLLFPSALVRPDVLAAVDGLLGRDLPAGLRRLVLEQRDELARALRGQGVRAS